MNKKLILGVVLAVLLASGAFFSAQAERSSVICPSSSSVTTPDPMGAPGV